MKNIIYIILGLILISCTQKNQNKIKTTVIFEDQIWEDGGYKIFETLAYDIDKDNVLDTIEIYKIEEWNDPGDFHKIEIKLSSNKNYEIYNTGDWMRFENEELTKIPNKLNSKNILITEIANNREILIIEGYSFASTPGKLTILGLDNGNISPLFQSNFHLLSVEDIDRDDIKDIIGWNYYSEFFGYSDSISIGNGYRPYYVLKISNDTIEVDTAASEIYNFENYIGFFGLAFDIDGRYLTIQTNVFNDNAPDFAPYFYFEKYREHPETSLRFLDINDLDSYSKNELRIIRNEIFAFHGYKFNSQDLNDYFTKFDWYKPLDKVDIEKRLNKYERANIKLIKELEDKE